MFYRLFVSLTLLVAVGFVLTVLPSVSGQQQTAPARQETNNQSIRIGSNEVLLDVVVRDKRGRPVRDLRPEEIEVYEDNARQTLASFRLLEANSNAGANKNNEAKSTASQPYDPAKPINLVTMVFDNLDNNGRRLARESANEFFQLLPQNTFVAIYAVNLGFHLIQPFTNDREKLRQAIELMARRADNRFPGMSKQIVEQLELVAKSADFGPPAGAPAQATTTDTSNTPSATALAGLAPSGVPAGSPVDKAMAQITLNTIRTIEAAQLDMQARASVGALINLVRQQKQLVGRKTVLYYSNGMIVPPNLVPLLRTAISEANQNNVSIYTLDARGLDLSEDTTRAKEKLAQAIAGSQEAQRTGAVSAGSFLSSENAEMALRMNTRGTLGELASGTGGFSVTNTNDLVNPLRRVAEELGAYYALTYAPSNEKQDGRFREVKVVVKRPDMKVQARSGYFAIPAVDGKLVMPHEMLALAAVNAAPPPHDFTHSAGVLHFKPVAEGVRHLLVVDTAFTELGFRIDRAKKQYELHVAILALFKDAEGKVVQRISQNYPISGKLERLESLKRGKLAFSENVTLPTGEFTVETVVHDFIENKTSVQKQPLAVREANPAFAISSLFLVKNLEPYTSQTFSDDKPLTIPQGKLTPLFAETVDAAAIQKLSFFCNIFVTPGTLVPPKFTFEIWQHGQRVARQVMELPKPDLRGQVPFLFNLPAEGFITSPYEMRAIIQQNEKQASETLVFKVNNPKLPADTASNALAVVAEVELKATEASEREIKASETTPSLIQPVALSKVVMAASEPQPNGASSMAAAVNVAELISETESNGTALQQRLLDYGYNLRKAIYTLSNDQKNLGKPTHEEFFDYEAYPVRGRHVLIHYATNAKPLYEETVTAARKRTGEALAAEAADQTPPSLPPYVTALVNGSYRNRNASLLIDPIAILRACEFHDPRLEMLNGRETIALDFTPRGDADLPMVTAYVQRMMGTLWIDAADKVLVRMEAYNQFPGLDKKGTPLPVSKAPKIVYQQTKLATSEWFPSVIRMNAAGDASALFDLNWDVFFEFTNYQKFGTTSEKEKLIMPPIKN